MASKAYIAREVAQAVARRAVSPLAWQVGSQPNLEIGALLGSHYEDFVSIMTLVIGAREMAWGLEFDTRTTDAPERRLELYLYRLWSFAMGRLAPPESMPYCGELAFLGHVAWMVLRGMAGSAVPPDISHAVRRYLDDDYGPDERAVGANAAALYLARIYQADFVEPDAV